MKLTNLPTEVIFKIAENLNRWDRVDLLRMLRLDNEYYGEKNRRPFPRKFLSLVPRNVDDITCLYDTRYCNIFINIPIKQNPCFPSEQKLLHHSIYVYYSGSGTSVYSSWQVLLDWVL